MVTKIVQERNCLRTVHAGCVMIVYTLGGKEFVVNLRSAAEANRRLWFVECRIIALFFTHEKCV